MIESKELNKKTCMDDVKLLFNKNNTPSLRATKGSPLALTPYTMYFPHSWQLASRFYNSRVYLNSFCLGKLDSGTRTSLPKIKIKSNLLYA